MTVIATGWAVVRPDGIVGSFAATENKAWSAAYPSLLRPLDKVIEEAKARGARAFRCEVREIGEEI